MQKEQNKLQLYLVCQVLKLLWIIFITVVFTPQPGIFFFFFFVVTSQCHETGLSKFLNTFLCFNIPTFPVLEPLEQVNQRKFWGVWVSTESAG